MPYMEQMQSTVSYLATAGEAGRRNLDGMMGPVNGAISEMTGAASELETLPVIGPMVGEKLQRVMRGISAAQAKVGAMVAVYNQAARAASQIEHRLEVLGRADHPGQERDQPDCRQDQSRTGQHPADQHLCHRHHPGGGSGETVPPLADPAAAQARSATAAFEELNRQSGFRWASQERLALEQRLAASDQSHYRALTNEKTKHARLRDHLATADLRLSVQLAATAATGFDAVQATTSTGGVVYGAHRAKLDSAHAQRIIGLTGDGDQGMIALQACQSYVKTILGSI